jgi:arylformamidase
MRIEDYPPQDPVAPQAVAYREACMSGSFGVPFGEITFGPDPHQSVAIYPAPRPGGRLFAFIHGGGWTSGYKEAMGFMAPAFTARGITFASIGHRLAPAHLFPAGFEDCAAAIALLYERADAFGYDRRKIFVGGHSSGGNYASLLAVRDDWQAGRGLPADVIRGCLPISGVYRLGAGSGTSARPRFLGPEGSGLEQGASPLHHIGKRPPPFLMAYGEKDFPHLIPQAEEMAQALREAGGRVEVVPLLGRTHFTAQLAAGESDGPWLKRALDFLEREAGNEKPAAN